MGNVGVIIGTYGNRSDWREFVEQALCSIDEQTAQPYDYIWAHDDTLAKARNGGAKVLDDCEHLIFLDADDELDPRYIQEMKKVKKQHKGFTIIRPSTLGVYEKGKEDDAPVMIPRSNMKTRNCAVIGSMVDKEMFDEVGGFPELPCLEDWAIFRAMLARGATLVDAPEAVYRVHVREGSRNTDERLHGETYRLIQKEYPL